MKIAVNLANVSIDQFNLDDSCHLKVNNNIIYTFDMHILANLIIFWKGHSTI